MAQAVIDGIQQVGSVGTLVGASMETAGHYTQSAVLDQFANSIGPHLGGLLYLIAVLTALITLASGGSYRFGLWLLVGPPIFMFLTTVRSPSSGAEWKFGQRQHDEAEVKKGTRGLTAGDGTAGEVSTFFKGWNMLTSDMIQGLIELLRLSDDGSDLDFMNKADRYMATQTVKVLDPLLVGFVNMSSVNLCADYFYLKKFVSSPEYSEQFKEGVRVELEKYGKKGNVFNIANDPVLKEWRAKVLPGADLPANLNKDLYTCDDLWALGIAAFKKEAPAVIKAIVKSNLPGGLTEEEATKKLLIKFGMQVGNGDVIKEFQFANTDDLRLTMAINEIAARLMFGEISKLNPNLAMLDMNEHKRVQRPGEYKFDEETSRALRQLQSSDEYQYKGELIIGALTLPYLQGCVLYFLAVTFPFFALMTIVPGRHTTFLLWMGLWLWAKLWDFGFAVVMVIDNMLYALMPHGPAMTDADIAEPGRAFKALLETDPSYSVATYYNLLSCCLIAVPIVTGFLVHRGGEAAMDAVQSTFREFPAKFGTSTAAYKRALMAQHNLAKARMNEAQESSDNMHRVSLANESAKENYLRRTTLQTIKHGRALGKPVTSAAFGRLGGILNQQFGIDQLAKPLDPLIEHEDRLADRQALLGQQMLAYKESKSGYNFGMAGEAILNRYNSHDFRRQFPHKTMIDVDNARRYMPLGGLSDYYLDWGQKSVIGEKPK